MIYFHKLIVSIMVNSNFSIPYFSLYHQFLRVFKHIRFINQNFRTLITYYVFTYIYIRYPITPSMSFVINDSINWIKISELFNFAYHSVS